MVAYGFIDNCLQATLKAQVNDSELSTVVTCAELCITKGDILHKLAAKCLIDDWQYGLLSNDDDPISNDLARSRLKQKIIDLSRKYSISSEYTSFIAIEERDKQNPAAASSQSPQVDITRLLTTDADACSVDILPYMGYDQQQQNDSTAWPHKNHDDDDSIALLREALRLAQECAKSNKLDQARVLCKTFLGKYVNDLDSMSEETYEKTSVQLDRLRDFMTSIGVSVPQQVYVKTLTGKTITTSVNFDDDDGCGGGGEGDSVGDLKRIICDREGVPVEQQRLIFAGRQLQDHMKLSECGLSAESSVNLVLRLRGGPGDEEEEKVFFFF